MDKPYPIENGNYGFGRRDAFTGLDNSQDFKRNVNLKVQQ
jgi:hypothetical protein